MDKYADSNISLFDWTMCFTASFSHQDVLMRRGLYKKCRHAASILAETESYTPLVTHIGGEQHGQCVPTSLSTTHFRATR
jgi:hypothetical protein